MEKETKGISLIVLVITIIIMIILAGAIILSLSKDNVILKSKEARDKNDFSQIKEQIEFENNNKLLSGTFDPSNVNLGNYSSKIEVTATGKLKFKDTLTDIQKSELLENTSFMTSLQDVLLYNNPNSPSLSGLNPTVTYYVTYDSTAGTEKSDVSISNATPSGWYQYKASTLAHGTDNNESKWANIKTSGNGLDAYWVWIPRYAYKIGTAVGSGDTRNAPIDIKFLNLATNIASDESDLTGYTIHPAFTAANQGKELTGIWVSKFELTGTTNALTSKPNQSSLVSLTVKSYFDAIRKMEQTGGTLGLTSTAHIADGTDNTADIETHMLKNSEWGAAAYLAQSKYGRNGQQIYINNYYVANIAKTGYGAATASASQDTTGTSTFLWSTVQGQKASTTGNMYGIYDMSGGAWEYAAGYYGSNAYTAGSGYPAGALPLNFKYYDNYLNSPSTAANNRGHATAETSGWFSDTAMGVGTSECWTLRSGGYSHGVLTGLFHHTSFGGGALSNGSTRAALCF